MVEIASHRIRMGDAENNARRLGPFERNAHLARLEPLEELVRRLAPLNISYDVGRIQPPYFQEFSYTEFMGGLILAPQSCELAARVVEAALAAPERSAFDPVPAIMSKDQMDKYRLAAVEGPMPKRVAMLPGSNIFEDAVCRETLTREMHRDPDLMIKPHPMTAESTLRTMGRLFGYRRILEPGASGWAYLAAADEVLVTTTTEMGFYAMLLGKRIGNVTKVMYEARGAYAQFYRPLWGMHPQLTASAVSDLLRAPACGFLHPDDPDVEARAQAFFDLAMHLREPFRPRVLEYDPSDYGLMIIGRLNRGKPENAVRSRAEGQGDQAANQQ